MQVHRMKGPRWWTLHQLVSGPSAAQPYRFGLAVDG